MAERKTSLSKNENGVPVVSFGASASVAATPERYDINGFDITAWYDDAHKLLVVLDSTISDDKPNAMLILDAAGNRKWDDILENDFGITPDSVRPRVDNKYQNLDIEYDGLSVYNRLINDYNSGDDLTEVLDELADFRFESVRRNAAERLADADHIIATANITIVKTNEALAELDAKHRDLNSKLRAQKKTIGKISTKQSASKILRLESQMEELDEKIARANRRIVNAERRMAAAELDADAAREILSKRQVIRDKRQVISKILTEEPKATEMADEVKPLFEKDPNIMDENIAFKPIEFRADENKPADAPIVSPLSFTAPTAETKYVEPEPEPSPSAPLSFAPIADVPDLDSFASDYKPLNSVDEARDKIQETNDIVSTLTPGYEPSLSDAPIEPEPEVIAPQPVVRPVSPLSGAPAAPVVDAPVPPPAPPAVPVAPIAADADTRRPSFLYYVLLIILIALSIFTLWLYQKNTVDTTPSIAVVADQTAPVVAEPMPEPAPVVEPASIIEPEPQFVQPATLPATAPEFVPVVAPELVQIAPEPAKAVVSEPAVNKPPYDVSGGHKLMTEADFYAEQTAAATTDAPATVYVESAASMPLCDDGTSADVNGCCTGEFYADLGAQGFNCCTLDGANCYPPLTPVAAGPGEYNIQAAPQPVHYEQENYYNTDDGERYESYERYDAVYENEY